MIEIITSMVAPDTWEETGGTGKITGLGDTMHGLVIAQTDQIHDQIADLLEKLRQANVSATHPVPSNGRRLHHYPWPKSEHRPCCRWQSPNPPEGWIVRPPGDAALPDLPTAPSSHSRYDDHFRSRELLIERCIRMRLVRVVPSQFQVGFRLLGSVLTQSVPKKFA